MKGPGAGVLPAAAAAVAGILVGSGIVATRFVIDQSAPASLALLRYAIGVVCLAPLLLMSPRVRFAARDLAPVALLGIAQFGVLIALLNFGLLYISAGLGALIFAVFPLLTLVLAATLGQEALSWRKALGVAATIVGVGLALADKLSLADTHERIWLGATAVFASALCGAVCSVLYRPYLVRYPTLQVGTLAMAASVVFLTIPAAWEGFFDAWPGLSMASWLAVVFIGVSSGVGYYLWLWALGRTTPTRVTVFLALSPLTAAALGALALGETVTAGLAVGVACVAAGLWLALSETATGPP